MKRLFDFVMSLIGIVVLSPIILIVSLAVKFTSPGTMLFKQRRIGKNNVEFEIYKFRTMRIDTPNVPTHLLENPEQWITPVGKFLRKTYANSINETVILDESLYECIEAYDEIVSSISKLESRKKVIEHKLQSNLKEYEIGFCKERKITWKSVTKTSVDTKKLREDIPEVIDGYLKTSTSRVFRIGR